MAVARKDNLLAGLRASDEFGESPFGFCDRDFHD
jgi:hypothetical protein